MAPENEPIPTSQAQATEPEASRLRAQLVDYLVREGAIRSPRLEQAFAQVPREIFLPSDIPLSKVYSDDAIVVKWDENRVPSSSSSQPYLMADMIETLNLTPGMRVLEIGAGVGYNAAILAHFLGDGSLLTSVELDPLMAQTARQNLNRLAAQLGESYSRVTVVTGDGSAGYGPAAPYDRIIVTVQQWDISPQWVEQLQEGGILLLPLTFSTHLWGGLIPAFQKNGDLLKAIGTSHGSFMPMRGELAHPLNTSAGVIPLPLEPQQVWVSFEETTPKPARLFVAATDLPEPVGELLKRNEPLLVTPNGCESLELNNPPVEGDEMQVQRLAFQIFQGFTLALAVARRDQLFPLLLGLLQTEQVQTNDGSSDNEGRTALKDNYRYELMGVVLIEEAGEEAGYDLALLTFRSPAERNSRVLQGWRLTPDSAGRLLSSETNRAIEKALEVWQTWQTMGEPSLFQYRPLAFPAGSLAPEAGYLIQRRFYDFLLPFQTGPLG